VDIGRCWRSWGGSRIRARFSGQVSGPRADGKDIYEVNEYKWYFRALETRDEYFEYYRKRTRSGGFMFSGAGRSVEKGVLQERFEAGTGIDAKASQSEDSQLPSSRGARRRDGKSPAAQHLTASDYLIISEFDLPANLVARGCAAGYKD